MAPIDVLDTDLPFVKNTVSVKCNKAKHNKRSNSYIVINVRVSVALGNTDSL